MKMSQKQIKFLAWRNAMAIYELVEDELPMDKEVADPVYINGERSDTVWTVEEKLNALFDLQDKLAAQIQDDAFRAALIHDLIWYKNYAKDLSRTQSELSEET